MGIWNSYSRSAPARNRHSTSSASSLLLLHVGAAALDGAGAPLGHDDLRPALGADVDLADLVRHARAVLLVLSPAEAGLPAREEGPDPDAPVRGGLQQHVEVVLQPDPVRERQVKGPHDPLLAQAERERPLLGERVRRLLDRVREAVPGPPPPPPGPPPPPAAPPARAPPRT